MAIIETEPGFGSYMEQNGITYAIQPLIVGGYMRYVRGLSLHAGANIGHREVEKDIRSPEKTLLTLGPCVVTDPELERKVKAIGTETEKLLEGTGAPGGDITMRMHYNERSVKGEYPVYTSGALDTVRGVPKEDNAGEQEKMTGTAKAIEALRKMKAAPAETRFPEELLNHVISQISRIGLNYRPSLQESRTAQRKTEPQGRA